MIINYFTSFNSYKNSEFNKLYKDNTKKATFNAAFFSLNYIFT